MTEQLIDVREIFSRVDPAVVASQLEPVLFPSHIGSGFRLCLLRRLRDLLVQVRRACTAGIWWPARLIPCLPPLT